ncbi:ATP-dependent dethiobiotin synthetase BioD [Polynucleobacter necessarius]|uniref:ATP-dependent dethiobiotin synthetase BioD n=1 Tax=Polynucleobacter necessarius TaxID=576610 RepID=UPI0018D5339B|nr:dethiobiotin synthase [Polynucleobacter necessarius]
MSNHSGYFITGTNTEVGKTLVSGALIVKLREQGKSVLGFKPVVAGTYLGNEGQLLNEDIETLRVALGNHNQELTLCPYVLNTPAAPHIVAKSKGIDLKLNVILHSFRSIQQQCDCCNHGGSGRLFNATQYA